MSVEVLQPIGSAAAPSPAGLAGAFRRELAPRFRATILALWTAVLGAATWWILANGFHESEALSNFAKVLVVTTGRPIELENFGLMYPQVPLFLLVPFCIIAPLRTIWSPYIISVLAGATTLTFFHGRLRRAGYPSLTAMLLSLLIATHPFFLWAVSTGTGRGVGLLAMYGTALGLMRLRHVADARAHLLAALALAVLFFVDASALYISAAIVPVLPFFSDDEILAESPIGLYTVIYTPFVFAVLAWMYLNWLFLHDPFAFLRNRESAFLGARGYSEYVPYLKHEGGRFFQPLLLLASFQLLAFPAAILTASRAIRRASLRVRVLCLMVVPVLAGALATGTRFLDHPVSILVMGFVGMMIAVTEVPRRERLSPFFIVALISGHVGAWLVMGVMPTKGLDAWRSAVVGISSPDVYAREHALARAIAPLQGILVDDRLAFPAIAERKTGRGLILPFDAQFKLSILTGILVTPFVAVPDPSDPRAAGDAVAQRFPSLYANGYEGYRLYADVPGWRVYERIAQPPATVIR